ncbi:MAG: transketolase C-terminal domain-containing protein [Devosia sp.]
MGELIGEVATDTLYFVERSEFDRVLRLNAPDAEKALLFADLARINTLYMIARAGSGHIGSSFSTMDMAAWLHLYAMDRTSATPDIYFSSKGHDAPGLYALLTALGVQDFELIHRFRRLDGLPGHPDRLFPGMVTNTGSLGMGISKAKGMSHAMSARGEHRRRIFVVLGDGELQEGQIWESLVSAANRHQGRIIAIVDHNKLQSDTFVSETSDLGDLEAKFQAFGWNVKRVNGHDIEAFALALSDWRNETTRPKMIIADTVKGKGISFMEHTAMESDAALYRFHSGAPDAASYSMGLQEILDRVNRRLETLATRGLSLETVEPPARVASDASIPVERLVPVYTELLLEAARKDGKIVALDADLALDTGLLPFKAEFPARFVECGISEMDMVSQAGGMALQGLLPICHSFACFLGTRANEQIYNNATEKTKVGYVGALAGILPAAPGHSHQSVRDISAVGGVPHLILADPASGADLRLLFDLLAIRGNKSFYLRITSIPWERPYAATPPQDLGIGQGYAIREGKDGVIFAYGPVMLANAWRAAERIAAKSGKQFKVINLPFLNQIDLEWLKTIVLGAPAIVTVDNHYIAGGLGEKLLAAAATVGWSGKVRQFGLTDVPPGGQPAEVLERLGLDCKGLAKAIGASF